MIDIQILNDTQVQFQKKLWHESEIILARCFNFDVNVDTGSITGNISVTAKKALYEFIKMAFKNFSESPDQLIRREAFYRNLDAIYEKFYDYADGVAKINLPYFDNLYQHQKEVLHETFYKKHNFYALSMGLGKSLTSASVSRIHQIPRTLIVCPAAVKYNWFRDLVKFGFNELYFTILDSSKRRTLKAFTERFVIINYDILEKFLTEICHQPIGHFILDEAHVIKNHTSLRAKNLRKIIELNPDARITFLSGTPIKNRVDDVFSYLKMIGHELGQNHTKFLQEYTVSTKGRGGDRVTGGKNLNDLHIKLSNFMIRRTKEECLDLPGKVFLSYKFELDDYREEYNKIIEELSKSKEISRLSSNLHSLNIITSKAKKKGIIEIADNIIAEGRKVVIFGSYKEPINDLEAHWGHKCVKIDGSVESFKRDQLIQQFIHDPEKTYFLANMIAGGVGINLVNASDVIFINFPFTPAELYQAIDRCYRIGQTRSVNVHYTFCEESIDEYIYEIIVDKEKDINSVVDRGNDVLLRENMTELLIKKLLHRDDVTFSNPFQKASPNVEETKTEEITDATEMPTETLSDILKGDDPDKYYLMVGPDNEEMFICTADEFDGLDALGCTFKFSHNEYNEVLKKGRHLQMYFSGKVNLENPEKVPLEITISPTVEKEVIIEDKSFIESNTIITFNTAPTDFLL